MRTEPNPHYTKSLSHPESGVVLVVMTFVLPIMLILASMAIDIGNYYRRTIHLQNAADAAALGAMGYAVTQTDLPETSEEVKSLIEEKALELAEENLKLTNVVGATISPTYDTAARTLAVDITAPVPYLFGYVTFGDNFPAAVTAETRREPANIHLALDFSQSMGCPRDGNCSCLLPGGSGACTPPLRVADLRSAVQEFLARFDSSLDRIGLSVFNIVGEVAVPIRALGTPGFDPTSFNVINTTYQPRSNTNITDGLTRSYLDLSSAGIVGNDEYNVIVFSDGAPTASRFLLDGTAPGATLETSSAYGVGNYDYLSYIVQWDGYVGPSLLVKSHTVSIDYNDPNPPVAPLGENYVPACSTKKNSPPKLIGNFNKVFSDCVPSLGFQRPGSTSGDPVYGGNCGPGGSFANCFRQQYYHTAIEIADQIRASKGTVYAIGLGPDVPMAAEVSGGDAYQDIDDVHARKDFFLTRLANDYLEAVPVSEEIYGGSPYPEYSYSNYRNYASWKAAGIDNQGRYYHAPSSEELKDLFASIARRVLLRLTR